MSGLVQGSVKPCQVTLGYCFVTELVAAHRDRCILKLAVRRTDRSVAGTFDLTWPG